MIPRYTAFVLVKRPRKRARERIEYPPLHSGMRAEGREVEFCLRFLDRTIEEAAASGSKVVRAGLEIAANQREYPPLPGES